LITHFYTNSAEQHDTIIRILSNFKQTFLKKSDLTTQKFAGTHTNPPQKLPGRKIHRPQQFGSPSWNRRALSRWQTPTLLGVGEISDQADKREWPRNLRITSILAPIVFVLVFELESLRRCDAIFGGSVGFLTGI
jgi:hypothetical protein